MNIKRFLHQIRWLSEKKGFPKWLFISQLEFPKKAIDRISCFLNLNPNWFYPSLKLTGSLNLELTAHLLCSAGFQFGEFWITRIASSSHPAPIPLWTSTSETDQSELIMKKIITIPSIPFSPAKAGYPILEARYWFHPSTPQIGKGGFSTRSNTSSAVAIPWYFRKSSTSGGCGWGIWFKGTWVIASFSELPKRWEPSSFLSQEKTENNIAIGGKISRNLPHWIVLSLSIVIRVRRFYFFPKEEYILILNYFSDARGW